MTFADYFSEQAGLYARHRPTYPSSLFDYLASIAPARRSALDCATGNGQAAIGLARHFSHVTAIDASAQQIARAMPHERVEYRVALSEATGAADASADLVTVAQGVHWFDLDRFYAEIRRVLRPDGVIALWGYQRSMISPEIDAILARYSADVVGRFWDPASSPQQWLPDAPFPFAAIEPPRFQIVERWTVEAMLGYLASWSSSRSYLESVGEDPLESIRTSLSAAWPDEREVCWDLHMKVGHL